MVIQVNEHWAHYPINRGKRRITRLLSLLNGRGYIAGSFAAWACSPFNESWKPNDIDIFAKSDADAASIVDDLSKEGEYWYDTINDVATTFHSKRPNGLNVQIIRPSPEWKTFPDDLINSFDLDVCRAVILSHTEALADENAGYDIGKVLRINNPLRTLKRIIKYSARGVSFNDHELLKVFRAWNELPAEKKEAQLKAAADELTPDEAIDSGFYADEDEWFEGE